MCSSDFGMYDFLFEREDAKMAEESMKTTLFSSANTSMNFGQDSDIWKEKCGFDADELLLKSPFDADDLISFDDHKVSPAPSSGDVLSELIQQATAGSPMHTSFKDEGFDSSLRDLSEFPFESVMAMDTMADSTNFDMDDDVCSNPFDSGSSDSGVSVEHLDSQCGIPSSPDTLDARSDVSSTSDLSSVTELGSFPPSSPHRMSVTRHVTPHVKVTPLRTPTTLTFPISQGLTDFKSQPQMQTIDVKSSPDSSRFQTVSATCLPTTAKIINSHKIKLASNPNATIIKTSPTHTISTKRLTGSSNRFSFVTKNSSGASNILSGSNSNILKNSDGNINYSHLLKSNSSVVKKEENSDSSYSTPQTIIVTQAQPARDGSSTGSGGVTPVIRNGSYIKTTNGRSILLPVSVGDLNQVRTIKIITSAGTNANNRSSSGVRSLVSTVRHSGANNTSSSSSSSSNLTNNVRTALFTTTKGSDGRSLLKMTPTAMVTPNTTGGGHRHHYIRRNSTSDISIKDEPYMADEDQPPAGQPLVLTEEEKRLLRKEGISLPSKYPLTKMEERDLKRIRRKIRNKISAQDSRKRKKEYVDGLEDRVKNSSDLNQKLQKRIRHLESQNENLVIQLRRLQSIISGNQSNNTNHSSCHGSRSNASTSTALMMIILSAALFVAPSLRSENERDIVQQGKISNNGQSRNLLEVGSSILSSLEASEEEPIEINPSDSLNHLSDHDYAPLSKRARFGSMMNIFSPQNIGKSDPGGTDPPDLAGSGDLPSSGATTGGLKNMASLLGSFLDTLGSNWTDPGGSGPGSKNQNQIGDAIFGGVSNKSGVDLASKGPSVVVNLSKNMLRDDIELE